MSQGGRPRKLTERDVVTLVAIVEVSPTATMGEIQSELVRRTGVAAHGQTIQRVLREAGVGRDRRGEGVRVEKAPEAARRYGYTEAHRRQAPERRYPSSLTDAEWALVAELFESDGGRGVPPRYSRRLLVDACCYVVSTGCAWRMLPKEFPPWQNVYRTFRRWSAAGKFEQMHDRLRARWRARAGRTEAPTAAVLDAQSTRGSPQGGARQAMTRASRSRAANATWWSIPWGFCWR